MSGRASKVRKVRSVPVLLLLAVTACDGGSAALDAGIEDAGRPAPSVVGPASRPARLYAPAAHDGVTPLPLVLLLHGRSVDGTAQDLYFGMTRHARTAGFYVLIPDGTRNADGVTYWDVLGTDLDDHAYLRALVEETIGVVPVDPAAVFVVGHSNGAFMAYRLACDSADLVTGIASLAGSESVPGCAPSDDVSVLEIHGTSDGTVDYDGGTIAGLDYVSAPAAVEAWAVRSGCDPTAATTGDPLDLVLDVDGAETVTTVYAAGCRAGAELWTMEGVDHIPSLQRDFTPRVIDWLRAHPR
ncbi:MAG: hypothetical protein H6719_15105 [Sandaracinaceae bacterium]|nr:hypothetical protein [Sandaracinaceae bacterium]